MFAKYFKYYTIILRGGGVFLWTSCRSLNPPDSASQTESRLEQRFLHSPWQRVPILYNVSNSAHPHICLIEIVRKEVISHTETTKCIDANIRCVAVNEEHKYVKHAISNLKGNKQQHMSYDDNLHVQFAPAFLWPPCIADVELWTLYFYPVSIYLSIFFFSSPNLSRRRLDVCHTLTHGVALMRI